MTFQENLKFLRHLKRLSQRQLAEAIDTTPKTISHWETGYTEPSIRQLIVLAECFDVSIDELVGRDV